MILFHLHVSLRIVSLLPQLTLVYVLPSDDLVRVKIISDFEMQLSFEMVIRKSINLLKVSIIDKNIQANANKSPTIQSTMDFIMRYSPIERDFMVCNVESGS